MSDDLDDLDFEDDEELDELPVIGPGGQPEASGAGRPSRRLRRRKGNTRQDDARYVREAVIAEAQGRKAPEVVPWREQLAGGQRFKAEDALRSRKPTHNAGSGFGLAR